MAANGVKKITLGNMQDLHLSRKFFMKICIDKIYCQKYAVYIQSSVGDMYVFGEDFMRNGILGLGLHCVESSKFSKIPLMEDSSLVDFAATDKFCVGLMGDGRLCAWGNFLNTGGKNFIFEQTKIFDARYHKTDSGYSNVYASHLSYFLANEKTKEVHIFGKLFKNADDASTQSYKLPLSNQIKFIDISSFGILVQEFSDSESSLVFIDNNQVIHKLVTDHFDPNLLYIHNGYIVYYCIEDLSLQIFELLKYSSKSYHTTVLDFAKDFEVYEILPQRVFQKGNILAIECNIHNKSVTVNSAVLGIPVLVYDPEYQIASSYNAHNNALPNEASEECQGFYSAKSQSKQIPFASKDNIVKGFHPDIRGAQPRSLITCQTSKQNLTIQYSKQQKDNLTVSSSFNNSENDLPSFIEKINSFKKTIIAKAPLDFKVHDNKSRMSSIKQKLETINFNLLHQKGRQSIPKTIRRETVFLNAVDRISNLKRMLSIRPEIELSKILRVEKILCLRTYRAFFNAIKNYTQHDSIRFKWKRLIRLKIKQELLISLVEFTKTHSHLAVMKKYPGNFAGCKYNPAKKLGSIQVSKVQNQHIENDKSSFSACYLQLQRITSHLQEASKMNQLYAFKRLKALNTNIKGLYLLTDIMNKHIKDLRKDIFKDFRNHSVPSKLHNLQSISVIESFVTINNNDFIEVCEPLNDNFIYTSNNLGKGLTTSSDDQYQYGNISGFKKRKTSSGEGFPLEGMPNISNDEFKLHPFDNFKLLEHNALMINKEKEDEVIEPVSFIEITAHGNPNTHTDINQFSFKNNRLRNDSLHSNHPTNMKSLKNPVDITKKFSESYPETPLKLNYANCPIESVSILIDYNKNNLESNRYYFFEEKDGCQESSLPKHHLNQRNKDQTVPCINAKDGLSEQSQRLFEFSKNESLNPTDLGSYLKETGPETNFFKYCELIFNAHKGGLNLSLEGASDLAIAKPCCKKENANFGDFSLKLAIDKTSNFVLLSNRDQPQNSTTNVSSFEKDQDYIRDGMLEHSEAKLGFSKELTICDNNVPNRNGFRIKRSLNATESEEKLVKEMENIIRKIEKEQLSFDLVDSPKAKALPTSEPNSDIYTMSHKDPYDSHGTYFTNNYEANQLMAGLQQIDRLNYMRDQLNYVQANQINFDFAEPYSHINQNVFTEKFEDEYSMPENYWIAHYIDKQKLNLPEIKEESTVYDKSQMMTSKNTSNYYFDLKSRSINSSKYLMEHIEKFNQMSISPSIEAISFQNIESFRNNDINEAAMNEMYQMKIHKHKTTLSENEIKKTGTSNSLSIKKGFSSEKEPESTTKICKNHYKENIDFISKTSMNEAKTTNHPCSSIKNNLNDENINQSNRISSLLTPLPRNKATGQLIFDEKKHRQSNPRSAEQSKTITPLKASNFHSYSRDKAQSIHKKIQCKLLNKHKSVGCIPSQALELAHKSKLRSLGSIKINHRSSFNPYDFKRKVSLNNMPNQTTCKKNFSSIKDICFPRASSKSLARLNVHQTNSIMSGQVHKTTTKLQTIIQDIESTAKAVAKINPLVNLMKGNHHTQQQTKALSKPRNRIGSISFKKSIQIKK